MLNREAVKQLERKQRMRAERQREQEEYMQLLEQEYGQIAVDVLREDMERHRKAKEERRNKGQQQGEADSWDDDEREMIEMLEKNCPKGTRKG